MSSPRVALLLLLTALLLGAQFTAVSIRPNRSGAPGSETETTPGRVSLINVTPVSLVLRAFGVRDRQLVGVPDWARTERYDVMAVTEGADRLDDRSRQSYFQSMLAERWQLRFHRETRDLDVYSLQAAPRGHKMRVHTAGEIYGMKRRVEGGRQILDSTRGNIPRLVEILSGSLGEIVVNDTALDGEYDFTLEWVQDVASDVPGPALATALEEQLGLTLRKLKRPTEVIVIEAFEHPSEN